jgi:4'-phosphopantetheinyl transferase
MNKQPAVTNPACLALSENEVHIWSADLDRPTAQFYGWLSGSETQKAGRLYFERDRNRYIVCHGLLREILGNYLGMEPGDIEFVYSKNNKPALSGKCDKKKLRFSISHSEGMALYALTVGREIGVDVEYVRDIPEMEKLAERFFSPRESEVLKILSGGRKKEAFFNCWTRKEAFIKATGDGLSYPLGKFEVSLVPDVPARLINIAGDAGAAARWSIKDLKPAAGYAAALAVPGRTGNIACRPWAG